MKRPCWPSKIRSILCELLTRCSLKWIINVSLLWDANFPENRNRNLITGSNWLNSLWQIWIFNFLRIFNIENLSVNKYRNLFKGSLQIVGISNVSAFLLPFSHPLKFSYHVLENMWGTCFELSLVNKAAPWPCRLRHIEFNDVSTAQSDACSNSAGEIIFFFNEISWTFRPINGNK